MNYVGSILLIGGFLFLGFFASWPIAFGVFFMLLGASLERDL